MFPGGYFPAGYFPPGYFPKTGAEQLAPGCWSVINRDHHLVVVDCPMPYDRGYVVDWRS